ncbi:MAG: DUF4976 domain-containing protein [Betaproteobacteria bacterium]|nr:DUF4976 domain-containing protein [Betaproteobacteria bacterium]
MPTNRRPNILLITSDQQRGDCYGFEGRRLRTPHLDLLAAEGTRFSACITPNAVCQPARASILTGLLPLTHGVCDNGIDLDPAVAERGFAGQLSRAGYSSVFIGKGHFSSYMTFQPTGTPECLVSSAQYAPDWNGPYMGFEQVELLLVGHNLILPQRPPRGQHYERWYYGEGRGDFRNALYGTHLPPDAGAPQTFHSGLPVAWHNSTWVGDRTIEYIRAQARRAEPRPFCAWASFPDPHHPFDAPDPWSRMHHPADVELPRQPALDLERRPWWHRATLEGTPQISAELRNFREKQTRIAPQQPEHMLREIIANYYGMIALVDHNVGRILAALEESGQADNTLVVYTSDHGEWLGDHGLMLKGPMMYEGLLRVGLIARGPGVPAGRIVHDPVSTIDLAATFAESAGIGSEWAAHSRSLWPLILRDDASRDFAFNEWHLLPARTGVELKLRTVRTRTHKLTLELASGAGELYDLVNDPDEMDNRFDDPATAPVRKALTEAAMSRPRDERAGTPVQVGAA